MLGREVKNNLLILGNAMEVYTKNSLWVPILVEREFSMTFLIQEEGILMLGYPNLKQLVFETPEIGSEKVNDFPPRLATKGNSFSFLNILYLKQRK